MVVAEKEKQNPMSETPNEQPVDSTNETLIASSETVSQATRDIADVAAVEVITTAAVIIGALLYRFFIALALNSDFIGLQAQDLNLVTALLVAFALLVPAYVR